MIIDKDLKETMSLYRPEVRKNVKVAEPSDFPLPTAFHITLPGVPNPFWPRLPNSAAPSEDDTVPRVIAASTLVGCMNGAGYVYSNATARREGDYSCHNYYHILGMNFDQCLLPNNNLVYDAEDTQEQWLVSYNKETRNYKHFQVGEFFFHSLSEVIQPNNYVNKTQCTFFLSVEKDPGLAVTKGKVLKKGFYRLEIDMSRYISKKERMRFDEDDLVVVSPIEEALYKSYRKLSVKKGY